MEIVYAITGASGAPIALRMLQILVSNPSLSIHLIVSQNAKKVFFAESAIEIPDGSSALTEWIRSQYRVLSKLKIWDIDDMAANVSSGSRKNHGMIIAPCSMSTVGAIANGITMNLIQRTASVMLKERRKLILVTRESPLSSIHLQNMLTLSQAGAFVCPATTGFYTHPKKVMDMIDFVCAKALDLSGIEHSLRQRWTKMEQEAEWK